MAVGLGGLLCEFLSPVEQGGVRLGYVVRSPLWASTGNLAQSATPLAEGPISLP